MGLKEYQAKRDFSRTPEPRGKVKATAKGLRFVIQKHAATRLHYDFRLEAEGVLKSWAVPKGPSLDPAEKRLAVEVEDHPVEYGSFEGTIPEGEYGGGTVLLWDTGVWIPDGDPLAGLRKGSLKFQLEGSKLHGRWVLVRMKKNDEGKNNWLLMKEKDDEARRGRDGEITTSRPESVSSGLTIEDIAAGSDRVWHSNREPRARSGNGSGSFRARIAEAARKATEKKAPAATTRKRAGRAAARRKATATPDPSTLPGARRAPLDLKLQPELATLIKEPPAGDDWLHEIKFDGFRIQGFVEKGKARFITRNGKDWTERFMPLPDAVASLPVQSAHLDGEVVVLTGNRSSFQALQNALSGNGSGLVLYLFDLVHLDGYDLSGVPLEARKQALEALLQGADPSLRFSGHVAGGGAAFFREACRLGVEGMVSKRSDSRYRPGRGRDWVKVKCVNRQEFVIGGFTEPSGARTGLGALLVGVYEGDALRFAGKVGTGFNNELLSQLRKDLGKLEQKTPPFSNPPRGAATRGVHWVRPARVAEVEFTEWTNEGLLRHPAFLGLREDKSPEEVRREEPGVATAAGSTKPKPAASKTASPAKRSTRRTGRSGESEDEVAGVRLTNPDRVLFPEQGLTKLDLALYYDQVADWMLPHVADRPLTIVRCPEGREKPCFYQKHVGLGVPEAIDSIEIRETGGKTGSYLVVRDREGLVSLVQMGVLETHPWGSRTDDIEKPDRLIFDLDPDVGLPWLRVVEGALLVRELLEDLELVSWVKTTGGKGLHVVVPIKRRWDWDLVKEFCQAVTRKVVADAPDRYTGVASKARRKNKVYVDYLRNARGATSIAPYSTRALRGAPVATPLSWDELSEGLPKFDIGSIPARLSGRRVDPWADFPKKKQSITQAMIRKLASG